MTRTNGLPKSWSEAQERLAFCFGGPSCQAEVDVWLRQAVMAAWGVTSLMTLDRQRRALAFQKFSGVVLAIEDYEGDLAFAFDHRDVVRRAFARYFNGVALEGPEWRLSPLENDRDARASSEFTDDDMEVTQ